jgi:hypothetical protein
LVVPAGAGAAGKLSPKEAKAAVKREARQACKRNRFKCVGDYQVHSCERQSRRKIVCDAVYYCKAYETANSACSAGFKVVKKGGKVRAKKTRPWSC